VAKVTVRVHRGGVQRMLSAPFMVQEMDRRVKRGRRFGVFTSPYRTGHYSRSWQTIAGVRGGVAFGRLTNTARYAWFLEAGTRNDDGSVRMHARHIVRGTIPAIAGAR
jgi:hypothetical protein